MHPQQCDYDRIEVFSKMPAGKVHKHGIYCGGKAPVAINSESNVLRVIFSSDTSVQKTGFAAIFFTGERYLRECDATAYFFTFCWLSCI